MVALLGPALLAVNVNVTLDPTSGAALLTVLTTATSALGEIQIILWYVIDSTPNLLLFVVILTYLMPGCVTLYVKTFGDAKTPAAVVVTVIGATGKVVLDEASMVPVWILPLFVKILNWIWEPTNAWLPALRSKTKTPLPFDNDPKASGAFRAFAVVAAQVVDEDTPVA